MEAIGTGAIGGFVSLAVIAEGQVLRAETQNGGSAALLSAGLPPGLRGAARAVLMSSGPNRPTPLAQFTPGDAMAGLITGHRFPNARGANGVALNQDVLARMRAGAGPEASVRAVLDVNPLADAGLIALASDGRLHAADGRALESFGDRGGATLLSPNGSAVAVLHNAILPYRGLALIAAETALNLMEGASAEPLGISLDAGLPIVRGAENAIEVDTDNRTIAISVADSRFTSGTWSFGLGYRVRVNQGGHLMARLTYEPYLVAVDGVLVSIDGGKSASLAALKETASPVDAENF
ncbi:MAG TPA: hypothetical protein VLA00_06505 [Xanthobacteraceae bacterium]|nr:hypothetical protein [Xanthobacteraceae bacterium]